MLSGLAIDVNDPLARRDEGLEFLDVTRQLDTKITRFKTDENETDTWSITNSSPSVVDTHLLVIVEGLPNGVRLVNASGVTSKGDPYIRVFLWDGVLNPGQGITERLVFQLPQNAPALNYTLQFLSGQGAP
jgi:hypothetical protein